MTLDTLTATEADFGSELKFMREMVAVYNGTDPAEPALGPEGVFLAEARLDIRRDLAMISPHDLTWSGWVDSLADDAHALQWRALVAAKQIALAYKMTGEGPESLNYRMMREYEQRYTTALRGLPGLVRGTGGAIATSFRIQM